MDSTDTIDDDIDMWHVSVPEMTCDSCQKPEGSSIPLKNCSACHLVWYCDATCQRNHWKSHKPDCQRVTDRKKSMESGKSSLTSLGPINSQVRFLARSSSSSSRQILSLLKESVLLIDRSENKQPKPSPEEKLELLNTATDKVNQIFAIDPDHSQALFLAAQIHHYKGELNASITGLEELLDPQFGPPLITDDEDKITILVLIGKSYMKMRNFSAALPIYGRAWETYQAACKCCVKSSNQKLILSGISQCSYEVNDFDEAIETGLKAVWFNRHYNESYEFVIKSYRKQGKWDMALGWMKRALRYEAPWNEDIVKKNKQIYDELMAVRDTSSVVSISKITTMNNNSSSTSSSSLTKSITASSGSLTSSSSSSSHHHNSYSSNVGSTSIASSASKSSSSSVSVSSSSFTLSSSKSSSINSSSSSSSSSSSTLHSSSSSSAPSSSSSSSSSRNNRTRNKTTTISSMDDS